MTTQTIDRAAVLLAVVAMLGGAAVAGLRVAAVLEAAAAALR